METFVLYPDGHLGEFVEKFYVNYADSFNYEGFAEPLLNHEIFFSFGEHFRIGQSIFSGNSRHGAMLGNRITPVVVSGFGYHCTAGVILKPWGLHSAVGFDSKRCVNQLLHIASTPALKEHANFRALKLDTPELMLDILASGMKKMIAGRRVKDSFRKTFEIVDSMSMYLADMDEVASRAGFSRKTVIRLFNDHIGMPPLKYLHIKTIIESLQHLKASENISLTNTALSLGFFDQSHFIRVFKAYMGMTPSRFQQLYAGVKSVQF